MAQEGGGLRMGAMSDEKPQMTAEECRAYACYLLGYGYGMLLPTKTDHEAEQAKFVQMLQWFNGKLI